MTRRRGKTILYPLVKCNGSLMIMFTVLIVILLGIQETRGDYLMGGHLDNKDEKELPIMTRRKNAEETESIARTAIISSRTSNLEHDFDLELDLLGEQSASNPTRTSLIASSSSSEDATLIDEESEISPRYRIPPYAFNGGQPFSLEKDPITGQIDFEKAPPLKALEYNAEASSDEGFDDETSTTTDATSVIDSKNQRDDALGPNEINPYSPSFHDFLNLPVRYTYDKYDKAEKYPLISNSYANTKVQSGTNSYNTYNHKKYHEAVKAGVDVQTLYVQPSRKTYAQSVTKTITSTRPSTTKIHSTTTTTTPRPKTSKTTTTTTTTTTTQAPPTATKRSYTRLSDVTTWKPKQNKPSGTNIYGVYTDYEDTLPIERLQGVSTLDRQTSTEKSRYASPPPRPKPAKTNEDTTNDEYEEGYEDYDRIFQTASKPQSQENHNNENDSSEGDYTYSLDLADSQPTIKTTTDTSIASSTTTNFIFTSDTTSTMRPTTTIFTNNDRVSLSTVDKEDRFDHTTMRPSTIEEKRVTSMPLDTIGSNDHYRVTNGNYGNNGQLVGTIDNTIPSVTSNNVVYQQNRPSNSDQYYARPPIGMPSGGIVVKSTSNVVVPPGQDTVSFVLGNRQSVGSVSDAGSEFYGIHASPMNDRSSISFGKIGNSRPAGTADNFSGQMIVSAGIGVGSNPIGSYHQRPPTSNNNFNHAVVTVGMPTVDIINPGESGTANGNKNVDSSTNSLDSLAQKWWASTSAGNPKIQSQEPSTNGHQFGHRVVFPNDKLPSNGVINENSPGTQRPIEEHIIVVHESEIGNGNTLRLDLPSQSTSTSIPTTGYHYESTTQRLSINPDEKLLPELSESLTPPAERPNILPSGIQRPPSYNYYHHHHHHHHQQQPHSPTNSRPNDYRDQRPQRPPSSVSSSTSFKRRPPSSSIDTNLPNILPQFRPNAKTSHGHNRGETIGTIPAGPPYINTRLRRPPSNIHHHRPSSPSRRPNVPSHLQRLNPPPLPPPPPPITSLRLPTPASLIAPGPNLGIITNHDAQNGENIVRLPAQNRLHKVTVGVPPSLAIDERHHQPSGFGGQPLKSRLEDDSLERFSAEPPQQPPRPPYFTKRTANEQLPDGMPRIATLQMIQQHGGSHDDDAVRPNLPPPYRFNNEKQQQQQDVDNPDENEENSARPSINRRGDDDGNSQDDLPQGDEGTRADYGDTVDTPVYVVYPVKGALDIRPGNHENDETDQDDASVVLGTYGSQRPLPPDTLLQDSDDSSDLAEIGDGYGPSSNVNVSPTFTDSLAPQLASDFPYPLERPDPSMFTSQLREKPLLVPSEQQKNGHHSDVADNEEMRDDDASDNDDDSIRDIDRDASVNVIPYLQDHVPFTLKENAGAISATLHRLAASSSIVAASSTPIAYVYTPTTRAPVRRNEEIYGNFERGPVLLPSQQPSSSSSSAPSPQSFMAPFVASASAEAPTKNGWSVVMIGQSPSDDAMDRRRHDTNVDENDEKEKTSEKRDKQQEEPVESNDDKEKNVEKPSEVETQKNEDADTTTTEKSEFDVENFTPQLFGGFLPIFPPETDADSTMGGKINGGISAMVERPRSGSESV